MKKEDIHKFKKPSVTVDIIVFTIKDDELQVLLIKRGIEPFKEKWALPGGFVRIDESLEDATKRELKEETGVENVYLEQLYTFGDPKRDPRGRVITVAYMALVNSDNLDIHASTDVSEVRWFPIKKLPSLAFDHKKILDYSLRRLRWKFEYTTVAFSLLQNKFTLAQLKNIYDLVFDKNFDKRNFAKKIIALSILKEEGMKKDVSHRPPMMYSLKKDIGDIVGII